MSRTSITRLSRKASSDRATLDRLLDTVHIGHFAIIGDDAQPVVLPTAVVRDGDRVLAHGSTGSRWLRRLAAGAPQALPDSDARLQPGTWHGVSAEHLAPALREFFTGR